MSKHTPGPWSAPSAGIYGGPIVHGRATGPLIAVIADPSLAKRCGKNVSIPCGIEAEANAHLIAAAPDLLDALKAARDILETARRYFPKSIRNHDRFGLLNVLANSVIPAIDLAEGRDE